MSPRGAPQERDDYDVLVVGSGAAGGAAAHVLTRAGARVLMLEAGGPWDNRTDSDMFTWPYETKRRGGWIPSRHFGEFDACVGGWWLEGEPYTVAEEDEFSWWRARMVGGRTNHWGRISLRFGPDDFRRGELDGLSPSWPLSYEDLEPYYDELDRFVGIFGSEEGLRNHPDGIFQPPPRPRLYELLVMEAAEARGIPCIPGRLSILTEPRNGRPACHYCGQCNRGCSTNSNFSSTNVFVHPAVESGRLTLVTDAMVREVTVDEEGRATGVHFIDKITGEDRHAEARVVVLAASAFESVRLLMNSTSPLFPDGIGASSGHLGRWITDSTGTTVSGHVPRLSGRTRYNEDGAGGGHVYIPWWLEDTDLDFPRGYHAEVWGGYGQPGAGFMSGIHRYPDFGGYGRPLKEAYREHYGTVVGFFGRGEMVPNADSYVEIDPEVTDEWGIPALKIHFSWSDHERLQVKHMQETLRGLIREMGGEPFGEMPGADEGYGISTGGTIIHELGGARMGEDPSESVVDPWLRLHEVPNLYVVDGAPFVSQPDKNPTWTIMALAWRTSERILREMERGRL
ncbi:MAG: GMC family oxidoreductase [Gemmatimonadota bacterium]